MDRARLIASVIYHFYEGTSFFDFKRWHLGVDRNEAGSNHTFMVKVPAGDKRWVYQIPQDEIESNSQMVQNE